MNIHHLTPCCGKEEDLIHYAITDPKFYTQEPLTFKLKLQNTLLDNHIDYICYRDKENAMFEPLAEIFVKEVSLFPQTKAILHTHVQTAHKLGAFGVHLSSLAFEDIAIAKDLGLFVIVSTHNETEALKAEKLGADAVTFSPVFATPNKGKPCGLEALKQIMDKITIKVVALGGITTQKQLNEVAKTGVYGFASIRYFV